MNQSPASAIVREPGTGRGTWAMASLFEHLLEPEQSSGRLAVALTTQPPGLAPPLHRHTNEAEAFFLLSGRMTYRAGDEVFELYGGCFIYLPRGLPHAFRVRGDEPVRYLTLIEPGGLLHLYDEVGMPAPELRLPGADGQTLEVEIPTWNKLSLHYGIEVLGPPIPE